MFLHTIGILVLLACSQPTLDERIDPGRLTVLPAPEPVQSLVPPSPPIHRISGDPRAVMMPPIEALRARAAVERGVGWLMANQDPDGGWGLGAMASPTDDPDQELTTAAAAITGLGIKAVAQSNFGETDALKRAIDRLLMAKREDFGIPDGPLYTYMLSTITSGLASLQDPDYRELVSQGVAALRQHQWDEGEGLRIEQDWFGGAGYGSRGRPDLSNTQMMLDAFYDAGVEPEDPAFQRAVVFLTRCQNLNTTNPADWAGADGGFVYTAANGGESMASEADGHGRRGDESLDPGEPRSLRSYGSMTYAGYKSLLYAGLGPDDPRVQAALNWARNHWTVSRNPGLGQQGYYYYLSTMARALRASGIDTITTNKGRQHNWRSEMASALLARQQEDGSWTNTADRWLEGRQDLATIYAVLALEELLKPRPPVTKEETP